MKTTTKLNKHNIGQHVEINGWVKKTRRMGDLVFIDLRDMHGIVQIVVEHNSKFFEKANTIRSEYTVVIKGKVVQRKAINPNIFSGEIEIILESLEVISEAKQTPLIIDEETDALEQTRLEYRYLDLRRPNVQKNILIRSNFNKVIRDFMHSQSFIEIETPIITKPSPGGAKEFKVLSENHKDKYYSLVQSPQVYKQLLMYSGIEKYYQIARCFRDEDARSDRQLEFTQLDLEMAWSNEIEIQNTIEQLIKKIWKEILNIDIKIPFEKMSYDVAINKYGSDKPDTRFENTIVDITNVFANTNNAFIKKNILENKVVKAIFFENSFSSNLIKQIDDDVRQQGGKGLSYIRIENNNLVKTNLKDLKEEEISKISSLSSLEDFSAIIISDSEDIALEIIGRVRISIAKEFKLINQEKFDFLWIVDWPMFEIENEKIQSKHNPFTSVALSQIKMFKSIDKNDLKSLLSLKARAYDLVLNGFEIGGGSIRFNNIELQRKVFEIMKLTNQEIEQSFGWFLKSMDFGTPIHGGIALGLDRILAIMLNQSSIRDVIAFPKSTSGIDEMTKAPIFLNKNEKK